MTRVAVGGVIALCCLTLARAREPIVIEAESFDQVSGPVVDFRGARAFEFGTDKSAVATELKIPAKEKFGIWIRLYFPHPAANAVYVSIDEGELLELTDQDVGRWHWLCVGRFMEIGPMDSVEPPEPAEDEVDELDKELAAEDDTPGGQVTKEDVQILNQGKHSLAITPSAPVKGIERPVVKGKGVRLDKIVLYFGDDHTREKWFLGSDHDLMVRPAGPARTLASQSALLIEAESAQKLVNVEKVKDAGASGGGYVEFGKPNAEVAVVCEVQRRQKLAVWARVYFDTANRAKGDANSFRFYRGGKFTRLVTDQDKDRWHWVSAGTYAFSHGKHLLAFRDAELPVRVDAIVLYTGEDPIAEPWYVKLDPLASLLASKKPTRALKPDAKQLVIEAEAADDTRGTKAKTEKQTRFLQLPDAGSNASFLSSLPKERKVQVWAKVRHDEPRALLRLYLDSRLRQTLRGRAVKGKWYWLNAGSHELAQGPHLLTFWNVGAAVDIDQVILYAGEDVRREAWYQEFDRLSFLLFSPKAPPPRYTLQRDQHQLLIELEDAEDRERAGILRCDASGGQAIEFRQGRSRASIVVGLEQSRKVEVWTLAYFDARNAIAGDANSFHLAIDGARARALSDTYKDEWHWMSAGTRELSAGRHVFTFTSRELPVRLDMLALYAGEDAKKESWFTKQYPFSLPFDIANDISGREARRISLWRAFGRPARTCQFSLSRKVVKQGQRSVVVHIPEGGDPGALVIERRVPVRTSEAFTERNKKQQIDLWLHGDGSGVEVCGMYLDATGECFEGRFAKKVDFQGWRLVSLNIGGDSRVPEARHEGGNEDGVPDYPLRFQYLVVKKVDRKSTTLHFEEPEFVRPVTYQARLVDGRDSFRTKESVSWRITAHNASAVDRTVDVHWELVDLEGSRAGRGAKLARVPAGSAATVSASASLKKEGVYCLRYHVCADQPRTLFFAVGDNAKAEIAAFKAEREKKHHGLTCEKMAIPRDKVGSLYGAPGGLRIVCDGIDVCSQEYADACGIQRLKPVGYDLSDEAGWPEIRVPPGTLAIDPPLGRYKFAEGDTDRIRVVGTLHTGFGVPGCGRLTVKDDYVFLPPGEGDMTIVDVSDKKRPKIAGFLPTYHFFYDAIFFRDYLYFNPSRAGPQVADFNDPVHPLDVRPLKGVRRVYYADEEHGLLYASAGGGLAVMDPTENPAVPRLINCLEGCGGFIPTRDRRHAFTYLDGSRKIGVLDTSDPVKPQLIAQFHNHFGTTTDKEGNIVEFSGRIDAVGNSVMILRTGNSITVYDISDITAPVAAGTYDFAEGRRGVSIGDVELLGDEGPYDPVYVYAGDEWYAGSQHGVSKTSQHGKLYVLDLTDRCQPRLLCTVTDPDAGKYNKIAIEGRYAYIHDYNRGLRIFDLRDPQKPEQISSINTAGEGRFGGYVHNGYTYLGQTFTGSVIVMDVRDPTKPKRRGRFWDGGWITYWNRLAGKDDCLYVLKSHGALIVDVADPDAPKQTGEFLDKQGKPMGRCGSIFVDGSLAGLLRRGEVHLYDVTKAGSPKHVSALKLPRSDLTKMTTYQGHLILSGGKTFCTVDIRDRGSPRLAGLLSLDDVPRDDAQRDIDFGLPGGLVVNRGYAYVTAGGTRTKLHIVDVRDPASIRYVKLLDPLPNHGIVGWANYYHDLITSGDYLFVCNYGQIECFDISDPESPEIADRRAIGYQWSVGQIDGEYLYVPTLKGLYILDVPHTSQVPKGKLSVQRM